MGLCDRFHKLPSEVLAEDAELLRLLEIERLGRRQEGPAVPYDDWPDDWPGEEGVSGYGE